MSSAIRGDAVTLTMGGDLIGESKEFSIALDVAEIDVSSRDSSRWSESLVGRRSWTITGSGLYIAADVAKKIMVDHYTDLAPTNITVILTIGSQTFTGTALLSSLQISASHEGAVEYSFTLKGTGALTISAS